MVIGEQKPTTEVLHNIGLTLSEYNTIQTSDNPILYNMMHAFNIHHNGTTGSGDLRGRSNASCEIIRNISFLLK